MHKKKILRYFSKFKISNAQIHLPSKTLSGRSLSSCKRTKTPSFALDGEENEPKLSDLDRFLYENFRSLYEEEYEENKSKQKLEGYIDEEKPGGVFWDTPPENLCGSDRFFVTPASSSSLMEKTISKDTSEDAARLSDVDRFLYEKLGSLHEKEREEYKSEKWFEENNDEKPAGVFLKSPRFSEDTSEDANENQTNIGPDDFIRVSIYSLNPYDEFRQSMHEMIQARLENNGKVNWEFMEELLFCYLNVNAKKSYRVYNTLLNEYDYTRMAIISASKDDFSLQFWEGNFLGIFSCI